MAEGAALEMPCTGNRTVGSNPTPSAIFFEREVPMTLSVGEKGSAARRRPKEAREAYSLYVERAFRGRQRSRWALIGDRRRTAVLDGEVAVPCNPQSATAGLNSLSRADRVE